MRHSDNQQNSTTPIPIVSIVGKSNSGKTTLIEKIIPELIRRGWRVGTIKHNMHGFEIDHEGKDSWRHRKAGARMTVLASPHQVAVVEDVEKDYDIGELRDRYLHGVDIILVEGYKQNPYPKIEVFRPSLRRERLCSLEDNLIAVASDEQLDAGVPCLDINNIEFLADMIEERFLKGPRT
jgi:molybdopterin-guanine dinucleotide biosynthesis adapter protein